MNDFLKHSDLGHTVLYADDAFGHVSAGDPDLLLRKLQVFADTSTRWIQDNQMVCSAPKTKLLIVSTNELRESKLHERLLSVKMGDTNIEESPNESLLGITLSNNMSWNSLLYGNKGLLGQLSQRIGMIKQLSKYMSSNQLSSVIDGLFTSKLLYFVCLFSQMCWALGIWMKLIEDSVLSLRRI